MNTNTRTMPAAGGASVVPFNFKDHPVRVVMRDGEPWFVAADVCAALGYANPSKAVADHLDEDEKSNQSLGLAGKPVIIINESGLYALVLRSHKPEARKFAKWVTGEVLPSIRKTGSYAVQQMQPQLPVPPGPTITAEQADELRRLLNNAAAKFPEYQQGEFTRFGYGKLHGHFKVNYRNIPASQFSEAVNIIARHALEFIPRTPAPPVPLVPALPPQEPTATLDAQALYSVWTLINHFKHIHRIYKQYNLYTHLTGLGSPAGVEMHDHFWHGLSFGADCLEKRLGQDMNAARYYLREYKGMS